eukprot:5142860-Pyramimonas_sp.AAC.2
MRGVHCRRLRGSKFASVRVLRRFQEEAPEISVRGWTAFRARPPKPRAEVQSLRVRPAAALAAARECAAPSGGTARGGGNAEEGSLSMFRFGGQGREHIMPALYRRWVELP